MSSCLASLSLSLAICSQLLSAMKLNELRSKYKGNEKRQKTEKILCETNYLFPPKKEKKKQTDPEKKANKRR